MASTHQVVGSTPTGIANIAEVVSALGHLGVMTRMSICKTAIHCERESAYLKDTSSTSTNPNTGSFYEIIGIVESTKTLEVAEKLVRLQHDFYFGKYNKLFTFLIVYI